MSLRKVLLIFSGMVLAAVVALVLTPKIESVAEVIDLEQELPRAFGEWKERKSSLAQVTLAVGDETSMTQPYDQTVMRSYENGKGEVVMLALAWGRLQRQEVKVHRPELCYVSQGFKVVSQENQDFSAISSLYSEEVKGKRMVAFGQSYGEAVMYWIRIGDLFSEDAVETRLHILAEGLKGNIPDGILVRASMKLSNPKQADSTWPVMQSFLDSLVNSASPRLRQKLIFHE